MRKNNLFALLLAGVTAVGTLAAGTTVQADQTTTVNLNIAKQNTSSYTLTVPAKAEIDASGEKKELGDGINIKGTSDKNVKVTATSANSWNLVNGENKIGYHLYNDYNGDYDNDKVTEWEFTASEIAQGAEYSGAIKYIYTQANADDLKDAAAGTYSDTITFTAETVEDSGNTGTFAGWNEGDTIDIVFKYGRSEYVRQYVYDVENEAFSEKNTGKDYNFGQFYDEDEEKSTVKIYEESQNIFSINPKTKKVTLTEMGEYYNVNVTSLKVNGVEWIDSSSSGGDNEDDTDNLPYIRVTSDNIEELLGQYNGVSEDHIYGSYEDEDAAIEKAKELAKELYQESNSPYIYVIYKYDNERQMFKHIQYLGQVFSNEVDEYDNWKYILQNYADECSLYVLK